MVDGLAYELLSAFEPGHQGSIARILHHEEDVILIIEVAVEFDDVGVVQAVVNFQLSRKLILHPIFANCRFEDLFYRAQEASFFVDAKIDVTEFAGTNVLPEMEVRYLEVVVVRRLAEVQKRIADFSELVHYLRILGVLVQGQGEGVMQLLPFAVVLV